MYLILFGQGVTIPVIRDQLGDSSSVSNYRPITLSPVILKIFEYCVSHKFEHLFYTDPLQFGFQKDLSCSSALFVLSQTVDYFVQHGSNVFMAALDARKAVDRVNHVILVEKLTERRFPGGISESVDGLVWYNIFMCQVGRLPLPLCLCS